MDKPAPAEIRALPSAGVLGVIELAKWAADKPADHLWESGLFLGGFVALCVVSIYGLIVFFQHWRLRVTAPALIVASYALVAFSVPAVYVLVALALSFVAVAYFVSPDRNAATAHIPPNISDPPTKPAPLTPSVAASPILRGQVERFERIDGYYISDWTKNDLRRKLGREPYGTEPLNAMLHEPGGHWYIAWVKVETLGTPSKTSNWSAYINLKDGEKIQCLVTVRDWGAPKTWPSAKYYSLPEILSMFLENKTLYNVLVHVRLEQSEGELNMTSFKALFLDDNNFPIECAMQGTGDLK